jgi:transcriptional regulator with XRE-family HTH domain
MAKLKPTGERGLPRLVQLMEREREKRGWSQGEAGRHLGATQQAYNTWTKGVLPGKRYRAAIAEWLKLAPYQMDELIAEIEADPAIYTAAHGAAVFGQGADGVVVFFGRPMGYVKPSIGGCYALVVDDRTMWVSPDRVAVDGSTVVIRKGNTGRIAKWPVSVDADESVHVVVLSEL